MGLGLDSEAKDLENVPRQGQGQGLEEFSEAKAKDQGLASEAKAKDQGLILKPRPSRGQGQGPRTFVEAEA